MMMCDMICVRADLHLTITHLFCGPMRQVYAPAATVSTTSSLQNDGQKSHRVLVVGGGRMGQIRAAAIFGCHKTILAGLVESDLRKGNELSNTYHTPVYPDLATALSHIPDLDGVWISTPTPR